MKLGFGLMRLPTINGESANIDIERVKTMVDEFISAGGTYFDTAYMYHSGKSEEALREAIVKRYDRSIFTVTDKLPLFTLKSREEAEAIFSEQLTRCGVDYFDYYWLHAIGEGNYPRVQNIDAFGFIKEKQRQGKIKHIGFSFHGGPELLEKILTEHPETEYVQLQINYLDWLDSSICAKECYEIARKHNKSIIVMEPVKGGSLANLLPEVESIFTFADSKASPASWAIRFAADLEGVMTVLSGMSNIEQVRDNVGFMKDFKPLTDDEKKTIEKAADAIRSSITIPCTACRYCSDGCPVNIAIPEYFSVLNNLKRFGSRQKVVANTYYSNLQKNHGKPSDCIECGACENACPQHIKIREWLKNITAEFGK